MNKIRFNEDQLIRKVEFDLRLDLKSDLKIKFLNKINAAKFYNKLIELKIGETMSYFHTPAKIIMFFTYFDTIVFGFDESTYFSTDYVEIEDGIFVKDRE